MSTLLWLVLAAAVPREDDSQKELENTDEIRHQVSFKLIAPDAAVFSVTREFAPRSKTAPMRLDRQFGLPDQSAVTSFAFRSDGTWRAGRLGLRDALNNINNSKKKTGSAEAPIQNRPWASFEGEGSQAVRFATPTFRAAEPVQIRYTLWAAAVPARGGRRWTYCGGDQNEGDKDEKIAPEIALPPGHPELRVLPDPDAPSCVIVEKTEPDAAAPTARFGTYRLGPHAWWWRLELAVPAKTAALPTPPETAPVVFVLDASRSQTVNGGLDTQLAIIESYVANTPTAEVELVVTSRTAERVFNRFVPAGGLKNALPLGLAKRPLGNGSSLDRGVELAVDALGAAGKPARIMIMTDGGLRSRFDRSAVVTTLRRAPAGTIVHVLYPATTSTNEGISHNVPEGLDQLSATFGGASYAVTVNRNAKTGVVRPPAPELLRDLVKPAGLESLKLLDASGPKKADWPEWPDSLDGDQAGAGETRVWSGVSETRPPKRLAMSGWVWAKNVNLPVRSDPTLEQRLARLLLSDDDVMECHATALHGKDALAQHFLSPELVFWVAGEGPPEALGRGSVSRPCNDGAGSGGGGGPRDDPQPKEQDIAPQISSVLRRCGMAQDASGTIKIKIETHGVEILDLAIDSGEDWERQCLENGIWSLNLPATFNQDHWQPVEYTLPLARTKKPATP